MKKRALKRAHHRPLSARRTKAKGDYLVVVRGWMFVVAFALMLGIGAIVGNFLNTQLAPTAPMVAGATTSR